ncbi:MAG TPA: CvpA family protein [Chloroflexota bacterium]|nr:CvpA family protein [Chloroflexota bacterium]
MAAIGTEVAIIIVSLFVFGLLGFWRGWLREITGLGVIAVSWLLLQALGTTIAGWVNQAYVVLVFTVRGGFDSNDPDWVLRSARLGAPIDVARPEAFFGILLLVAAGMAFAIGGRKIAPPRRLVDQILGAMAGLVNGYAILYLVSGLLAREGRLGTPVVTILRGLEQTLEQYLTSVFIGAVTVLIVAALAGSTRLPFQGKRARST